MDAIDRQMKKKLNFIPRIKKEILKGFSRIKWISITNFLFWYRFLFFKKKIVDNKIAILIPSKQRINKLRRFLESLTVNTYKKERIYVEILIDKNEAQKELYQECIKNFKKELNINLYLRDEKTHNQRNNFLAQKINADLYFPLNDDAVITMKKWDLYLDEVSSLIPLNKPYSIWTKASTKYPYFHSEFPIVNNKWYKTLGYIGNYHLYGFIDTWICDLGKISKKFIIAKKKFIDHLNVEIKGSIDKKDKTYYDQKISEKNDLEIWIKTKEIRIKDSKKLT
tara:strand:- start:2876 stop:3718 length:843 start_codon:yes stop_codon:yes gene_type:complete